MSYSLFASTSESKDTIQVIAADLDADADLDVVAFNTDGTSTYDHDVYLNVSGTLTHSATMGDSNGFKESAADDIDGDSDIDFVAVTSNGNAIVKYVNNGTATFSSTTIASGLSAAPTQTLLADVDSDGDQDIVIGSSSAAVSQAVYLNDGSATFTATASPLPAFTQIAATDFDSDGDLDLVLLKDPGTDNLFTYKNSGTGAFVQHAVIPTCADTCSHYGLDTADFDGDGDIDVLEIDADGGYGENWVYTNNGAGTFSQGNKLGSNSSDARAQSYGDIDNDGDMDAVTGGVNDSLSGGNEVYLNNGSASFSINGSIVDSTRCSRGVVFFDSDNDGDLDYFSGNTGCPATGGAVNRHYTSDQSTTLANTAPTAPSSFSAAIEKLRNLAQSPITSGDTGKKSAIAKGSDNLPVIAYVDSNQDIAVLHCGNITCSSGNTNTVVSAGSFSSTTSIAIAIGSDGYPVIHFHDIGFTTMLHCGNVACSSGNSEIDFGDRGSDVVSSRIGISNNLAYVVFVDSVDGAPKFFYCIDTSCSSYSNTTAFGTEYPADTSTAIGADGFPVVSLDDITDEDFHFAKCANATCSSGTTVSTIDTTGNVGRYSSVVVPPDTLPFASYYDLTNGNLKVVKCGNTSCSSGNTITTVDSTGDVGKFTSMALSSSNLPIITYFDATNNDLKVLYCGNATCNSGNVITNIDTAGTVGNLSTSVMIGSDNLPVISYYDTTNGNLKVLHCGQADCSGGGLLGGVNLRLSWGSGSDSQSAARMLQYQLRMGTTTNGHDVVSGATSSPNWVSRVMPNGQSRTYLLKDLPCDDTYYWGVATVDTGFKSAWSSERTLTIDSSCAIAASGSTPTASPGGGLPAWFFNPQPVEEVPALGVITVTAFKDSNADGKRQPSEEPSFRGLTFTASGSTTEGIPTTETAVINDKGVLSFTLPPPDPRGYSILLDTGSTLLSGFTPTTPATLTGILLSPNHTVTLSVGFKRSDLLRYAPCIRIGSASTNGQSDAETFLLRLEDAFGETIVPSFSGSLISRGAFFSALQRTQCIPLISDPAQMKDIARSLRVSFIDLLPGPTPESSLAYTLHSQSISVGRRTKAGLATDFSSPVTRREALQAIFDALHPSVIISTGSTLPQDLAPGDPLLPVFLTLQDLGILPESTKTLLGPSLGLTPKEAATLVARAVFRAGRIPLETPVYAPSTLKPAAPTEPEPTFLSLLPTLPLPSCLLQDPDRPKNVLFTDILPGDPLERDLRTLLAYGSPSSKDSDRMTWLLPGTLRPTEYGVERGHTRLEPTDPASFLETLRSLLVLSCMPLSSDTKTIQGSGETNVPRDRLGDLPRDESFASRVFYGAQDHQKEFDLSLLTYAPRLLRLPSRTPADPLNIEEASSLLASTLLRLTVDHELLPPQEAENLSFDLSNAIARDLLGETIDWRDEQILRSTPFTRGMLIHFLGTVITGRTLDLPPDITEIRPLGEIWWERVK